MVVQGVVDDIQKVSLEDGDYTVEIELIGSTNGGQ